MRGGAPGFASGYAGQAVPPRKDRRRGPNAVGQSPTALEKASRSAGFAREGPRRYNQPARLLNTVEMRLWTCQWNCRAS